MGWSPARGPFSVALALGHVVLSEEQVRDCAVQDPAKRLCVEMLVDGSLSIT